MDIQILKVEGTDVTAQITLDNGDVIIPTISITPYGITQIDPVYGKPMTVLVDPKGNVFNHLYSYGKNYQDAVAAQPEQPDFSDLVGKAQSFKVDEMGQVTSAEIAAVKVS